MREVISDIGFEPRSAIAISKSHSAFTSVVSARPSFAVLSNYAAAWLLKSDSVAICVPVFGPASLGSGPFHRFVVSGVIGRTCRPALKERLIHSGKLIAFVQGLQISNRSQGQGHDEVAPFQQPIGPKESPPRPGMFQPALPGSNGPHDFASPFMQGTIRCLWFIVDESGGEGGTRTLDLAIMSRTL